MTKSKIVFAHRCQETKDTDTGVPPSRACLARRGAALSTKLGSGLWAGSSPSIDTHGVQSSPGAVQHGGCRGDYTATGVGACLSGASVRGLALASRVAKARRFYVCAS